MASRELKRRIQRLFYDSTDGGSREISLELVNQNNYMSDYMKFNPSTGIMEVPVFISSQVINTLNTFKYENERAAKNNLSLVIPGDIIVPMYHNSEPVIKKTGDSILSLIYSATINDRLLSFNVPNNVHTYYGTRGLILDQNKNTLFAATNVCRVDEMYKCNIVSKKVYISPNVFINNDLVCKAIISKLLPLYLAPNFSIQGGVDIEIKQKDFVEKVVEPVENFERDLQKILNDNINDVLTITSVNSEILI